MTELSSESHRIYFRKVKRGLRWAKRRGYIDVNLIVDMDEPRGRKQDTVLSQTKFESALFCFSERCVFRPAGRDMGNRLLPAGVAPS